MKKPERKNFMTKTKRTQVKLILFILTLAMLPMFTDAGPFKAKKKHALNAAVQRVRAELLTEANADRLKKLGRQRVELTVPKRAMTLTVTPAGVVLAIPVVDTRGIPAFQFPNLDEADLPTGGYTTIDVTALLWLTTQDNARWDFMYRTNGAVVWRKPPIVAENARLGTAAVVLPQGTYEFLPLARVR